MKNLFYLFIVSITVSPLVADIDQSEIRRQELRRQERQRDIRLREQRQYDIDRERRQSDINKEETNDAEEKARIHREENLRNQRNMNEQQQAVPNGSGELPK